MQAAPGNLHYLYNPRTPEQKELASHFRQNIQTYNSAFAFASFGGKIDHGINQGQGPFVFKVNGEIYHWHGTLIPDEGEAPSYAQLYFYDAATATNACLGHNANAHLQWGILTNIHQTLLEYNHIARAYLHAKELLQNVPHADVSMQLNITHGTDLRRYNLPPEQGESIAVIIPNDPPAAPGAPPRTK